ncbi:MAG TPA: tyrosine-protein phosphatase [Streptosporangiaceae bacterium]|nr:tyrosine-protein phosphatase [Streptosporangiaceae bacterium]
MRWIDLDGAVNVRDLGGLPTNDGGATRPGLVLRADNLQELTPGDVARLVTGLGVRHVIDLRSDPEVSLEGPGPLTRVAEVRVHHLSLFTEGGVFTDVEADRAPEPSEPREPSERPAVDLDAVLPWQARQDSGPEAERSVGHYLAYLADRPDSIVAALRVMAHEDGASIVHCAAGKDRTGVVCALALEVAGVTREAVVADYVATGERLNQVLARLRASTTYAADLDSRPADSHLPHAYTMEKFLATVDERYGGPLGWLTQHGWSDADTAALRGRLVSPPPRRS